jgi:hypothetical protein
VPEPGWIPKETQPPDSGECLRLAFSCATGVHWRRLRFIDCDNFWPEWQKLARERGFNLELMTRNDAEHTTRAAFWIATVPSFSYPSPCTHAVVMKGSKLYYDSGRIKRKRAPTKLCANPIVPVRLHG